MNGYGYTVPPPMQGLIDRARAAVLRGDDDAFVTDVVTARPPGALTFARVILQTRAPEHSAAAVAAAKAQRPDAIRAALEIAGVDVSEALREVAEGLLRSARNRLAAEAEGEHRDECDEYGECDECDECDDDA